MATAVIEKPGPEVGHFTIHFAEGDPVRVPLRLGEGIAGLVVRTVLRHIERAWAKWLGRRQRKHSPCGRAPPATFQVDVGESPS